MTDILKGMRTYLTTVSSVTTLTSTRIYFQHLPQNPTYPSIALNLITSETQRHLTDEAGFVRSTVQADCHSLTSQQAYSVAEAVRQAVEHKTGTWGTSYVRRSFVSGRRDITEPPVDGSQDFARIRSLDVVIWHNEATT